MMESGTGAHVLKYGPAKASRSRSYPDQVSGQVSGPQPHSECDCTNRAQEGTARTALMEGNRIMKWFRAIDSDHVSRQARQMWDKVWPDRDTPHEMRKPGADSIFGQQPEAAVVRPNHHVDPYPMQPQHDMVRSSNGAGSHAGSTGAADVRSSCDIARGRRQVRSQPRRVVTHQTLALPRTPYRGPLALAGFQIVLGYAWLVAGVDKVLLAGFPAMLGSLLTATIHSGMVPVPFAAILEAVVVPHGALFGVLTEWGEQLTGLGLIVAGLTALGATPLQHRLPVGGARVVALFQRVMNTLWPLAALGGLVMGLSFYVVDGVPWQGFMPSVAFGGALDEGFLLAMGSAVLLTAALAPWFQRVSRERHPRAAGAHPQTRAAQSPRTTLDGMGKRA